MQTPTLLEATNKIAKFKFLLISTDSKVVNLIHAKLDERKYAYRSFLKCAQANLYTSHAHLYYKSIQLAHTLCMQNKYNYNPEIKEIPILNELAMV